MPCNPTLIWITFLFKETDLQQAQQVSLAQQASPEHKNRNKSSKYKENGGDHYCASIKRPSSTGEQCLTEVLMFY